LPFARSIAEAKSIHGWVSNCLGQSEGETGWRPSCKYGREVSALISGDVDTLKFVRMPDGNAIKPGHTAGGLFLQTPGGAGMSTDRKN